METKTLNKQTFLSRKLICLFTASLYILLHRYVVYCILMFVAVVCCIVMFVASFSVTGCLVDKSPSKTTNLLGFSLVWFP